MPALSTWNLDPTRILTRRELTTVLADLSARAARYANSQRNLIIVRLACCCGLRVSEIAGLQLDDVVADVQRPHLRFGDRLRKGSERGACLCGGMGQHWPTSWRGRRGALLTAPAAPTRSFVRCRPTGVACHFSERRCGDGFCRLARYLGWRGCER